MADATKCARCGATLTDEDAARPDKMKLCASCRSAATVKAPREQGSD